MQYTNDIDEASNLVIAAIELCSAVQLVVRVCTLRRVWQPLATFTLYTVSMDANMHICVFVHIIVYKTRFVYMVLKAFIAECE